MFLVSLAQVISMAKKSYADIVAEIEQLKAEAEAARREEIDGVIARIKEAISVYSLQPSDLFARSPAKSRRSRGQGSAGNEGSGGAVKYSDGQGNSWGGRGPRPQWLRDALANGASLESFLAR